VWPIHGLVSSYREGALAQLAVRSLLEFCDRVLVLEGPVEGVTEGLGDPSSFWRGKARPQHLAVREGRFASDAAKRTVMARWSQEVARGGEHWDVIVDGDEEMLFGYALPHYLARAEHETRGAMKLKIAEHDGQVVESSARCLPGHTVDSYLLSSYQIVLTSGVLVTLPHLTATKAPIMGEPHLLHRAYLRPPERNAPSQRLHEQERLAMVGLGVSELWKPGDDELLKRVAP
jgi:hypothetical protein